MPLGSRRKGMSRPPKEGLFLENRLKMEKEALLLESERLLSYGIYSYAGVVEWQTRRTQNPKVHSPQQSAYI
jgi:hypothetical protein